MPKLIVLGSANAVPDERHENTHLALQGRDGFILIDCVGNPVVRLKQAGLEINRLTHLVLTHFHPDHVGGVPSLLMSSWLLGRTAPLEVYGLAYTLDRVQAMMQAYEWKAWPDFFPVHFHVVPESELAPVLETPEVRISASPVHHLVPTIGLRLEFPESGKVLAYSCDTEPCDEVVRLAGGADVLIHESSGETPGHTSAAQAGAVARRAEAGRLFLIHYPTAEAGLPGLVSAAQTAFPGPVSLSEDFQEIDFA
jgi:ribonuclease Z